MRVCRRMCSCASIQLCSDSPLKCAGIEIYIPDIKLAALLG